MRRVSRVGAGVLRLGPKKIGCEEEVGSGPSGLRQDGLNVLRQKEDWALSSEPCSRKYGRGTNCFGLVHILLPLSFPFSPLLHLCMSSSLYVLSLSIL